MTPKHLRYPPGFVARFLCASGLRRRWLLVGRAAAHSCLGDWEASAKDAAACVEREPSFAKGWFRCDKPKPVHLIIGASRSAQTPLQSALSNDVAGC